MFLLQWHIFHDVRITSSCGTFALRMELTLNLRFVFVHHCDTFFISPNYVIYSFDVITFFDDARITLYFGTFELHMEIMLQLRFGFVRLIVTYFL